MPWGKISDSDELPAPRFFIEYLGGDLWEGGMETWDTIVAPGYDCRDFETGLPLPELIERMRAWYQSERRFHE